MHRFVFYIRKLYCELTLFLRRQAQDLAAAVGLSWHHQLLLKDKKNIYIYFTLNKQSIHSLKELYEKFIKKIL